MQNSTPDPEEINSPEEIPFIEFSLLNINEQNNLHSVSNNKHKDSTDGNVLTLTTKKIYKLNTTNQDLAFNLLEAVLNNRTPDIVDIVKKIDKESLYSRTDNKTVVEVACLKPEILPNTLQTLLHSIKDNFGQIDCVDKNWYGWEPIHYTAKVADPEKLKVLVEYVDVNALTYFSQNAFHVLLENIDRIVYGTFYNDRTTTSCTIIGDMSKNIFECAKIFLKTSLNVNHRNFWNESVISLAQKYGYHSFVAMIEKEFPGIAALEHLDHVYLEPEVVFFNCLKSQDPESFVNFINGNIKDYVDKVDGGDDFTTSGTMLQLCFRKVFLQFVQSDNYEIVLEDQESNILSTPMLELYRSSSMKRLVNFNSYLGISENIHIRHFFTAGEQLAEMANKPITIVEIFLVAQKV